MNITLVGLDLAKSVFHLVGLDAQGHERRKRKLRRGLLLAFVAQLPRCVIAMEACAGAHHWGRQFERLGHTVKLLPAQHVKAYRRGNKNDFNDARAICAAAAQPNLHAVPVKSVEQQELQAAHRVRQRLVDARKRLANQLRAMLAEQGVVFGRGLKALREGVPAALEDGENELGALTRELCAVQLEEWQELDARVAQADGCVRRLCRASEASQRLTAVGGIGPLIATATVARLADGGQFARARDASAWLGVVPRHWGTGGKTTLGGISKRGDKYLRTLYIHGARAEVNAAAGKTDRRSRWIQALVERRGFNRACVAVANKNVRIAWALLRSGESYRPAR